LHGALHQVCAGQAQSKEWSWSSVRAHLAGEDDRLVSVPVTGDLTRDRQELLSVPD
jgi:hypothetical protein